MSKFFNIIFIHSDNKPTRQIRIKKTLVYSVLATVVLLSSVGYYLLITNSFFENPSHTRHRKKIARKNLKLTRRILALQESHKKYSEQLNDLENKARQTMQAANVDLNIEDSEDNRVRDNRNLKSYNIHEMPVKTSKLQSVLDSMLILMEHNIRQMEFLPVMIPVSHNSFIIREFGKVKDPFSNKPSYHTGIDLSGQPGDEVFAPGSGVIKSVDTDHFYGKQFEFPTTNKQKLSMLI